ERQQLGHQDPALSIPARPVHLPRLPEADADLRLPDGGVGVLADSSILGIRHATMLRTTRARGTGGSAGTGAGAESPGIRHPIARLRSTGIAATVHATSRSGRPGSA